MSTTQGRTVAERAEHAASEYCGSWGYDHHSSKLIATIEREFADVVESDPRVKALVEASRAALQALESHLDEACRDHNIKNRDLLCPCSQNDVPALRTALAPFEK